MVKTLICKNVKMYLSSQDCMFEWFANWPVLQFLNEKRQRQLWAARSIGGGG